MNITNIQTLAVLARPIDDDDWGSERQIEAENAFFDAVEKLLTPAENDALDEYCLKATTNEMIDCALLLVEAAAVRITETINHRRRTCK